MNFAELIGRFHPLLVHLPIGFLLMGLILLWVGRFQRKTYGEMLPMVFLLGSISAVLSCITGYSLSLSGYEDGELVIAHRNASIFLSIVSIAMWWLIRKGRLLGLQTLLSILVFFMLLVTGHQGGSLTHGSNYLFGEEDKKYVIKPIENVQEAIVYKDIIAPIFSQKCVNCHGSEKQKGKLRLDDEQYILKGGKSGFTVVAGNKDKSEMLTRILLPPDDEDHMPPKEKGQLSNNQKALIEWWIAKGASFTLRVKELKQEPAIKPALASLSVVEKDTIQITSLPEVAEASVDVVKRLRNAGVVVVPVSQNSNLLSVNLINCTTITDSMRYDLAALSAQLYWLKAEGPLVNDTLVRMIGDCKQLRKLSLAGSSVTQASVPVLNKMSYLESLNLYQTSIEKSVPATGNR
jgi:mono/diheme cytochrome c family protein/uncharacterized membrane protein